MTPSGPFVIGATVFGGAYAVAAVMPNWICFAAAMVVIGAGFVAAAIGWALARRPDAAATGASEP